MQSVWETAGAEDVEVGAAIERDEEKASDVAAARRSLDIILKERDEAQLLLFEKVELP